MGVLSMPCTGEEGGEGGLMRQEEEIEEGSRRGSRRGE